jgi:hypothetical protein
MPYSTCDGCLYAFVTGYDRSVHWSCPTCHQPLRRATREEFLSRFRQSGYSTPAAVNDDAHEGKTPGDR